MALSVGQTFADYEILAEIGRGGMGAVYQARQISLQRVVALKILPPHLATDSESKTRFQSEAVAAASLNHPNIVQVFATGEADGIRYIAMEFVEGESIQDRLKRSGRLPITEALDITYHIAVALDHAWKTARLVHRDVKPDNVFLSTAGVVKLGDFGLAKMIRHGSASVTQTGRTLGSPHFMSPEQAHAQRDLDFRADIYSLGCALHYMSTGRMVHEGPDFLSIVLKHINEEPSPLTTFLAECPEGFENLVSRMLKKDRDQRHGSYSALIEEILRVRGEAEAWESSAARQRKIRKEESSANSPWAALGLGTLLMILIAGGFALANRATVARGGRIGVVTLADPSDRRDFMASLQAQSPEDRARRVIDKLREVNPAFDGKAKTTYEDGVLAELAISTLGVTNLWPLCALPELRVLRCAGDPARRVVGHLADLSPLSELPSLQELDCSWNKVKDLSPLAKIPLLSLRCARTRVETLEPLRGMPLVDLDISSTPVRDVAPLSGMPLEEVRCKGARVRSLSPLRGLPLRRLWCDRSAVSPELLKTWKHLKLLNDEPL